jgi:hypothetical protein
MMFRIQNPALIKLSRRIAQAGGRLDRPDFAPARPTLFVRFLTLAQRQRYWGAGVDTVS